MYRTFVVGAALALACLTSGCSDPLAPNTNTPNIQSRPILTDTTVVVSR